MSKPSSRPGGRSSRVKAAVFAAFEEILARDPGELPSMTAVAERAGVNPTSLYRRWTDARQLASAVAVEKLMRDLPLPDTGSVRGDLVGWAAGVAHSLSTRRNVALLRIMAGAPEAGVRANNMQSLPIAPRIEELESVLARGVARGERVPTLMDVYELVLAPIYLHALFLGPLKGATGFERLVDRALSQGEATPPTKRVSAKSPARKRTRK